MLTLIPVFGDRSDVYRALKQFQRIIFQSAVWLACASGRMCASGRIGVGGDGPGRNSRRKDSGRVAKPGTLATATDEMHSTRSRTTSRQGAARAGPADRLLSTVRPPAHRRLRFCKRSRHRSTDVRGPAGNRAGHRRAMKIRISVRVPYRGRIRVPIRHPTVRPIGPVERRTRIPIGTPSRANVSPYAPRPSTMANLSAIRVNTSFPLRHPSKIRCRCRGNHHKAQGCACQKTGNKLLHCNPRYREAR
jgi:hypothetical protein